MRLPPSPLPAKCPKVFEGETLGVDFLGVLEVNVRKGKRHLRVRPLFLGRVNVKFGVGSDASSNEWEQSCTRSTNCHLGEYGGAADYSWSAGVDSGWVFTKVGRL